MSDTRHDIAQLDTLIRAALRLHYFEDVNHWRAIRAELIRETTENIEGASRAGRAYAETQVREGQRTAPVGEDQPLGCEWEGCPSTFPDIYNVFTDATGRDYSQSDERLILLVSTAWESAYRHTLDSHEGICASCWGITPPEGTWMVPEDGELCACNEEEN